MKSMTKIMRNLNTEVAVDFITLLFLLCCFEMDLVFAVTLRPENTILVCICAQY